jgi:hypothetical protein
MGQLRLAQGRGLLSKPNLSPIQAAGQTFLMYWDAKQAADRVGLALADFVEEEDDEIEPGENWEDLETGSGEWVSNVDPDDAQGVLASLGLMGEMSGEEIP